MIHTKFLFQFVGDLLVLIVGDHNINRSTLQIFKTIVDLNQFHYWFQYLSVFSKQNIYCNITLCLISLAVRQLYVWSLNISILSMYKLPIYWKLFAGSILVYLLFNKAFSFSVAFLESDWKGHKTCLFVKLRTFIYSENILRYNHLPKWVITALSFLQTTQGKVSCDFDLKYLWNSWHPLHYTFHIVYSCHKI